MGAPVEPDQATFGSAVALMQQGCNDKKKEDEACNVLNHK